MGLQIKVEAFAGGDLDKIISELCDMATRLRCWTKCNLNGIEVLTPPDTNPATLWANYCKARDRGADFVSPNVIPSGPTMTAKPDPVRDAAGDMLAALKLEYAAREQSESRFPSPANSPARIAFEAMESAIAKAEGRI